MKKIGIYLAFVFVASFMTSCDSSETQEELNDTIQFEIQKTDKGDSINTGGGGNPDPDNGEE